MAITFDGQNDKITTTSQGLTVPTNVSGTFQAGGLAIGAGSTILSTTTDSRVAIGTAVISTSSSSQLVVNGQIESLRDSLGEGGQIVLRAQSGGIYRWNVDNNSTSSTFRIFREDDATAANGTTSFQIDSSGRVMMPYQPCFHATHSNNSLTTGEIVWGNSIFNTGSNYSTSTGRFTAPVSGNYFFRAHTLISNASSGEARIAIYKNSAGYGGLRFITIKPANQWWTLICEGHVSMTANEYVSVYMETNPGTLYSDSAYNSFSGHLVG